MKNIEQDLLSILAEKEDDLIDRAKSVGESIAQIAYLAPQLSPSEYTEEMLVEKLEENFIKTMTETVRKKFAQKEP